MSFLSNLAGAFLDGVKTPEIDVVTRHTSEFPSFDEQLAAIQRRDHGPWRSASVDEALGSPAIFAAVALISNTVATLSLEAYRNEVRLDQASTPRIIQRPDPFSTMRSFLQRSAFYLATRGECWWWIAKRDPLDNSPMSVIPAPPWEIMLEPTDNRLRPRITWGDRVIPNEDMRQIQYLPGNNGRGFGPLQKCGAAISVAVESEQWAANFFSGSLPSIIGTTEADMNDEELEALDRQWVEKPPNLPRWLTNGLTLSDSPFDPEKAQLRDVRDANVGDAAREFNIPGALLEYQMSGSSLTYRNDETIWTDFQRRCLSPHYLEPMEQEMSDLLTRSTVARFNLDQLLRASAKERAEINKLNIESGVYDAEYAARREGIIPGSVDFAPVPPALPQAIPTRLPVDAESSLAPPPLFASRSSMTDLKCDRCGKFAGRVSGAAEIKCSRCGAMVAA
jgi:HK97 family phage portal protein